MIPPINLMTLTIKNQLLLEIIPPSINGQSDYLKSVHQRFCYIWDDVKYEF